MTSTTELKKGLTAKSVLFGLFWLVVMFTWMQHVYAAYGADIWMLWWYTPNITWTISWWSFVWLVFIWTVPMFLIYAINSAKPGFFSMQETAIVYSIILMGQGWNVSSIHSHYWVSNPVHLAGVFILSEPQFSYVWNDAPWGLLAPKDEVILKNFLKGGVPVPWDAWMFPMLIWGLLMGSFILMSLFLGALLRKTIIEVEDFPFPLGVAATETIRYVSGSESEKPPLFRKKYFWLGMLISGVLTLFTVDLPYRVPLFAKIPRLEIDLSPMNLLPWAPLFFSFYPIALGWLLLVPMDALVTGLIFTPIFWYILPPLFNAAGLTRPMGTGRYFLELTEWGGPGVLGAGGTMEWPQGYMNAIFMVMVLIAIVPFVLNRGFVKKTLKAIFSKDPEIEQGEPMRYLYLFLGTIFFGVLWIIMLVIVNVPLIVAVLCGVIIVMISIAGGRFRGETGGCLGGQEWSRYLDVFIVAIMMSIGLWGVDMKASYSSIVILGSVFWVQWWACDVIPIADSWESYKVGNLTKTRSKDVFKAQILAVLVMLIVAIPIYMQFAYTHGAATNMAGQMSRIAGESNYQVTTYHEGTVGWPAFILNEKSYATAAAGFILGLVFYLTRMRYPGAILNPYGLLLSMGSMYIMSMVELIIAVVLKWLTMRIGGVSLYESKIVPLAVGLIFGTGIPSVAIWLTYYIR